MATPTPSFTRSCARPRTHTPTDHKAATTVPAKRRAAEHVHFGGDDLEVGYDVDGRLRGKVGGGKPQTAATYRSAVREKFPPGYYDALEKSFRDLLKTFPPRLMRGRGVYDLYDQWKKSCGVGRLVDLDRLLDWCRRRRGAAAARSA